MLKLIYSSTIGAIAAIIFATVITIWAEFSPTLKDGLKSISGHHWTTKSWATIIVYFVVLVLAHVLSQTPSAAARIRRGLYALIAVTILSGTALLGFFIWHYLQ